MSATNPPSTPAPGSPNVPSEPTHAPVTYSFVDVFRDVFGGNHARVRIELASQKLAFPINLWLAVVVGCLMYFWATVEMNSRDPGSIARTFFAGLFSVEGDTVSHTELDTQIYEFWTPSEKTAPSIKQTPMAWEELTDEQRDWYTVVSDDVLKRFARRLFEFGAQGFSYVEARGWATGPEKVGCSWEVTFGPNASITPEAFVREYKKYFKRDKNVYLRISRTGPTVRNPERRPNH